jgi:hypothetical protein
MPKPPPSFLKLPGKLPKLRFRMTTAHESALWLGEEFLVQVKLAFCRESYNRFYYNDIQALLLRRTSRGMIYSIVLGVIVALVSLIALSGINDVGGWIAFGLFEGFWVILLLVNVLRGATCRCQLQTSLGVHPLPSLNRMRPAQRALRMIAERVEQAQGALDHGAASGQMDDFLLRGMRTQTAQTTAAPTGATPV